ncbi:quinate utilization oxidoreductase protein [Rutstroemia sp. NJR-2017a BBW]|nr:quinate utilization oxidoreductase protein [Rutstroemia sp. NJR-2017a BBW]
MTAAAPPISIALIGSGLIGPRHAQSILRNPQTALHSLTDPAPHAIEIAKSLSTPYHDSISSLLSSAPLPTAVLICTPNSTHVPISISCIEAGIKYVLVEKPISTSIPEGIKLLSVAEEKGAVILVGHHRRFNPYLISTKAELDSGKLGRVIAVQGIWALKKPQSYFSGIGEWRRNGESGGVVLINLIHEVDLLQYLLGKVVAVSAFENGKGESAWNDVLKREEIQVNEKIVPFDEQIESLVQVVKEGKEPVCSGEEGLSAMIVCEAVRRSMKYGETVRIDGLHIAGEKN